MNKMKPTAQEKKALLYLFPALALLAFFFIWPIALSFFYSMTDMTLSGTKAHNYDFVALDNFKRLFSDSLFRTSFVNTLVFLFASIFGQMILGFILALLMKEKKKWIRNFTGLIVLIGWIMPEIVVSFCWISFFAKEGTWTAVLTGLGMIDGPISWLFKYPMVCVIVTNIWHGTAFSMMQFQAALDGIPREVDEAAELDGAIGIRKLIYIVLPLVKQTTMTLMSLIILRTLSVFGLIYSMTGGGPGTKTTTLSIYMYKQAFGSYQMGYGTAIALVMLIIGIIMCVVSMKLSKSKV